MAIRLTKIHVVFDAHGNPLAFSAVTRSNLTVTLQLFQYSFSLF
ncbi:hypothetical protein FOLKNPGA_02964 [Legionella sp. PC1000]|nr:hypothetical protein FOLKNPGA_02964 [Legionella sp. PC1000]